MVTVPRSSGVVPNEGDHPGGDKRFEFLDATMKRYRFAPDALIEVLHSAQELFDYFQPDLLYYIAHRMKLPPSRVYGVATFYHLFRLAPRGNHTCLLCTGTACYFGGADRLVPAVERFLETVTGRTTADGQVSLMTARCLGVCGMAPVAVYDGEVSGNQSPESALEHMRGWTHHGSR